MDSNGHLCHSLVKDDDTFTSTMFLNVDQLQKQLDKDEFQEDGSMAAFWVLNRQFLQFIDSQYTLDYDSKMTDKYFAEYTRIEYDRRVNKRQMQTQESMVDLEKSLDAGLVVMESSGTESRKQDTSNRLGNDTNDDTVDIRPVYDEEPMGESVENADLKAQLQEKVFAIAALKNELRKLKGNSVDTKFAKPSVLGKPVLQPLRNQLVVRQPTAFKSE
ncbi:hypothetical protein Tco_0491448 [Tanacetum coccineum]